MILLTSLQSQFEPVSMISDADCLLFQVVELVNLAPVSCCWSAGGQIVLILS